MFFTMESGNGNPFAEFMWMEEQEEFDKKVIEELLEEEQIQEDFEDMIAEERYHLNNSLQDPGDIAQLSLEEEEGSEGHNGSINSTEEASTTIPRAEEDVPWGSEGGQKSSEVSSDSDSEGGGPQR